jgi:DNA modification methylase
MQNNVNKIYNINNIEYLKTLDNNSIDSIITDVPYGLQDINALSLIKENTNNTKGFLNHTWDILPTIDFLKECNRVLKDGAFFITTFTARQDLQCILTYRLLEAGFNVNFSPILWVYKSGFPKAVNFSKSADKKEGVEPTIVENLYKVGSTSIMGKAKPTTSLPITKPTSDVAKALDGLYSCQLKPVYEPIIIAQKGIKEKTKIDHALTYYNERQSLLDKGVSTDDLAFYTKNNSGGCRIDDTRIPLENNDKMDIGGGANVENKGYGFKALRDQAKCNNLGRFPATLLVSDNAIDIGKNWSSSGNIKKHKHDTLFFKGNDNVSFQPADSGDLSRYFSLDAWTRKNQPEFYKLSQKITDICDASDKIYPLLHTPKPDPNSKALGLNKEEFDKNTHTTVKPVELYCYLISMFSSEGDIILDPYCGSGTTCIASVLTNRKFIGLELTKEYFDIANQRIAYWSDVKKKNNSYKSPTNDIMQSGNDNTLKENNVKLKPNNTIIQGSLF